MRTIACLLFLWMANPLYAQRSCASQEYGVLKKIKASNKAITNKYQNNIQGISGSNAALPAAVIRIPVVVHVVYNTAAENISDEQIRSGIAALNRDFRRRNADSINTPAYFKPFAADVEIEFVLATADPKGIATTGIVRHYTASTFFDMDDKIKAASQGGADAWDTKSYFNIWTGNTRRLLGYAAMPGGDEKLDGVVINYTAMGTIGKRSSYNMGRTLVHETGHWLGLQHLWGDEACGDDGVGDTPQQSGYTSGCPTGARTSCGGSANGDMYMNYMDFTNDACMNLFTKGQKEKMRAQFAKGAYHHALLSSKGLSQAWVEAAPATDTVITAKATAFKVFPNPSPGVVTVQSSAGKTGNAQIFVVDISGKQYMEILLTSSEQKIDMSRLPRGIYFLTGNINGRKLHEKMVRL